MKDWPAVFTNQYQESIEHPERFWERMAKDTLQWMKPWDKVFSKEKSHIRWFEGGKINASLNCLDRHISNKGQKKAIVWEGEDGSKRTLTYSELLSEVCQLANAFDTLGLQAGDTVTIYLPMIPEAIIAILACARKGLVHNVVFGGFSAEALAERTKNCDAKLVITCNQAYRKGKILEFKKTVDEALASCPSVKSVVVYQRTPQAVPMQSERDVYWQELVSKEKTNCTPLALDAEHPLFILYTSGSTGKPKGLVHTTGGYLLGAALSSQVIFGFKDSDLYWCTADIGWITGHSYIVYGPLANGASVFIYEGALDQPDWSRSWQMIEQNKISILYTAPTAIRSFKACTEAPHRQYDLTSLRLLGSVGESISPATWQWYKEEIGQNRCPIIDTWWQTETGGIMLSPVPGLTKEKPGSATSPFLGIKPAILNPDGSSVMPGESGALVITQPWPSMARTIYKDHSRYEEQYFKRFEGLFLTGDGAYQDEDGHYWILGRMDDVLNVSGHRLSTAEIEAALLSHNAVSEAAVIGKKDEQKGEVPVAFIARHPKSNTEDLDALQETLKKHVSRKIGALARPETIYFVDSLPKTRSGKIMRRLLRELLTTGESKGDISTLENASGFASLKKQITGS